MTFVTGIVLKRVNKEHANAAPKEFNAKFCNITLLCFGYKKLTWLEGFSQYIFLIDNANFNPLGVNLKWEKNSNSNNSKANSL